MRYFPHVFLCLLLSVPLYSAINEGQVYSGQVCNYYFDCGALPDISCNDPIDTFWIVVPNDGTLSVTGTLTSDTYYNCSNNPLQGTTVITLRNTGSTSLASKTSPGAFTLDVSCLAVGDSVLVEFTGTACSYTFQFNMINESVYGNDSEPNDLLSSATEMPQNTAMDGHIEYGLYDNDVDDCYFLVITGDGAVQVALESDFRCRIKLLNKSGGTITSKLMPVNGGYDTINHECLTVGDTFYIQVEDYYDYCGGYRIQWDLVDISSYGNDQEPNDTPAEANEILENTVMEGHLEYGYYGSDPDDYYRFVVTGDGTVQATIESDVRLYFRLYNKNQGSLGQVLLPQGGGFDTIEYDCLAPGDTLFLRVADYYDDCGGYAVQWKMINTPVYANDVEPNNTIAQATDIPLNTVKEGRLEYGYYDTDDNDYYRLVVTSDGTLRAIIQTDKQLYLRLYSKSGSNLTSKHIPAGGGLDSLEYDCLTTGDTMFLRVQDYYDACGGYALHWLMVGATVYANDAELNNTFGEAIDIPIDTPKEGRLEYGYYSTDDDDYYRFVVTSDGAARAIIETDKQLYLKLYNKSGSHLMTKHIPAGGGEDSLEYNCLTTGDTMFLRVQDYYDVCGGYALHWKMIGTTVYAADVEPNNTINDAIDIPVGTVKEGRLEYGYYNTDDDDYYIMVVPGDGTIRAIIESDKELYLRLYDKSGSQLAFKHVLSGGGVDSLEYNCLTTGDTLYLRVQDYYDLCGGYALHWIMIGTTVYADDTEPNNTFGEANDISMNTSMEGRLEYGYYNTDDYDYYRFVVSNDGTVRTIIESDKELYLRMYDKNQLQLGFKHLPSGGGTDSIDLNCFAVGDTLFIRVQDYYDVCGGYALQWKMIDTLPYDADIEPNNTYAQATLIDPDSTIAGHLGYGHYTHDNDDWYKTTMNGTGSLVIEGMFDDAARFSVYKGQSSLGSIYPTGPFEHVQTCVNANDDIALRINDYYDNCMGYSISYSLFYDANDSGTTDDTLDLGFDTWYKDNIGYNYPGPNGRDNVDVLKIVPYLGDSADIVVKTWALVNIELFDAQGNSLYNQSVNGEVTFKTYFHALETYYLKMSSATGCTPYKVRYNVPAVCPDEIYVTGVLTNPEYRANVRIIADGIIPPGQNVVFKSQEFDIRGLFEVGLTSVFETIFGNCNSP